MTHPTQESPLTPPLMRRILAQYRLPLHGPHGLSHWARVRENGLRLAALTGADAQVVELFAVFHDACRHGEGNDAKHGARGAKLAEKLRRKDFLILDDERFDRLYLACRDHTAGKTAGEATVQTCWDADRLDLLRVYVTPLPERLCTEAARDAAIMDWCNERARKRVIPAIVKEQWLAWLREGLDRQA